MNRSQAKELLPIIQAFVDEKVIQRKHGIDWVEDGDEIHLDQELRIKPEPRVIYVNMDDHIIFTERFDDLVKFIEVIE